MSPIDRDAIRPEDTDLDRRRFITYASALGVTSMSTMLAGCAGDENGNGNGTGNGNGNGEPADPDDANYGGHLEVAIRERFSGIDPHLVTVRPEFTALRKVVEPLFVSSFEGEIVPHLTTGLETENDGLRWIFPLQEDAHFHPPVDRPLTADDVIASWDRVTDPDVGSPRAANFNIVDDWGTIDENTVYADFDPDPQAGFLGSLEERGGEVLPQEVMEGETMTELVGTGPFMLEEWAEREGMLLEAYDNYWKDELPYVDSMRIRPITEASVRATELGNQDIQIDHEPPIQQIDDYRDNPDINVNTAPTQAGRNQLAVNNSDDILEDRPDNPPVLQSGIRHAIQHALDRNAYMDLIYQGLGAPNQTLYPPEYPWCEDYRPWDTEANVSAAEQEIADAGFDEPEVYVIVRSGNAREVQIAEILNQQLSNVGFEVDEQRDEVGVWLDRLESGRYDIRPGVGNVAPDPIIFDQGRYMRRETPKHYVDGPDNRADEVTDLFDQAAIEADVESRAELYQEAFNIIVDDGSYILLGHNDSLTASYTGLRNVRAHPSIMHNDYESVWFDNPDEFTQ